MAQELMIDVQRNEISISVRGTCLKMTCRKSDAPWGLTCTELRAEDPEAIFTRDEFKTLAWTAANLRLAKWAGLCKSAAKAAARYAEKQGVV